MATEDPIWALSPSLHRLLHVERFRQGSYDSFITVQVEESKSSLNCCGVCVCVCVLKITEASTRKPSHIGDGGDTTGQVMREELVILRASPKPVGASVEPQCWRSSSEDVTTS